MKCKTLRTSKFEIHIRQAAEYAKQSDLSFQIQKQNFFFSQTVFWETKHIFTTKKNREKKKIYNWWGT